MPTVFERTSDDERAVISGAGTFFVDADDSVLNWSAGKTLVAGYTDTGVVGLERGEVVIENGEVIGAEFVIDMNTIEAVRTGSGAGMSGLTNHLKSDDFFSVETYSTARFELTDIRPYASENQYEVEGNLTIKEITNPISFLAEIYQVSDDSVKAIARIVVDRTDYDIRFRSGRFFSNLGDNMIDDEFMIELELVANKVN
jgi:polyisoprenoid-binding protein YceI